jgi:hypothetical protein
MELINKLQWRYAAKAMNGEKVSDEKVERILEVLVLLLLLVVYNIRNFCGD